MTHVILCTDIGTTSLKTALFNPEAKILSYVKQYYENPAEPDWQKSFAETAKKIFANNKNDFSLDAISICGNGPTLASGNFKLMWNRYFPHSNNEYKGKSIFLPQILNFKEIYPASFKTSAYIYPCPEYLCHLLTGNSFVALNEKRFSCAYWTKEELAEYNIPEYKLPPYILSTDEYGTVSEETAKQFCIPKEVLSKNGTKVFCNGSDFASFLTGTNILEPGRSANRTGTSEGINLCTDKPLCAPGIRTLPSICENCFNASVLIPESGSVMAAYKETNFPDLSYEQVISLSLQNKKSEGYKIIAKTFKKEKAAIKKLNSVAKKAGCKPVTSLVISGPHTRFPEALQLKANILELPLEIPECTITELSGTFCNAMAGLKKTASIAEAAQKFIRTDRIITPE
jgi:sugar (pentulose or hexulose) kinase